MSDQDLAMGIARANVVFDSDDEDDEGECYAMLAGLESGDLEVLCTDRERLLRFVSRLIQYGIEAGRAEEKGGR